MRTGCSVRRVVHRNGKATGLSYLDETGVEILQPADIVIVASWTLNNARLLLLSGVGEASDKSRGEAWRRRPLAQIVGHRVAG